MFCKDLNAYDPKAIEYLFKTNVSCFKNALFSGSAKGALAKFQKGYCFVRDASLFNSEELEIHHLKLCREGEDHFS